MKIFKLFFVIYLISSFNHLEASNDDVKSKITKNLRCLVCQGQSVYDSDSEFAISMKVLVDKKLEEGFTEIQIYDFFRERYGEWILYDPKLNKNTYILWLLPILIFLIGGAIIIKVLYLKKINKMKIIFKNFCQFYFLFFLYFQLMQKN